MGEKSRRGPILTDFCACFVGGYDESALPQIHSGLRATGLMPTTLPDEPLPEFTTIDLGEEGGLEGSCYLGVMHTPEVAKQMTEWRIRNAETASQKDVILKDVKKTNKGRERELRRLRRKGELSDTERAVVMRIDVSSDKEADPDIAAALRSLEEPRIPAIIQLKSILESVKKARVVTGRICVDYRFDRASFIPVGGLQIPTEFDLSKELSQRVGKARLTSIDLSLSDSPLGITGIKVSGYEKTFVVQFRSVYKVVESFRKTFITTLEHMDEVVPLWVMEK